VGTPGVVDPVTGTVSLAPQLPGWEGLPLADQLALPVPCRVLVDNEVRLAVLGEQWTGAAQGIDDAVYVHLGVGIGLGILVGGRIYRGSAGAAGEIGYLPVTDTDGGQPGATGALEHAAGASAFARLGRQAAARAGGQLLRELAGGRPEAVDALVVFDAARQGDRAATAVVDTLVRRLARGVAAVCLVLNPSTVIVGGGLSRAGSSLLEPLERHTAALVPFASRWVLSALGDEAVAYGAVRLALQTVDEQLYAVPAGASA
jgi:predicted NBD/HSP70 family sugar kinase